MIKFCKRLYLPSNAPPRKKVSFIDYDFQTDKELQKCSEISKYPLKLHKKVDFDSPIKKKPSIRDCSETFEPFYFLSLRKQLIGPRHFLKLLSFCKNERKKSIKMLQKITTK